MRAVRAAKASLATPRRVIGRLAGGAVRLSYAIGDLVLAKGVETALSAAEGLLMPAWAALTADNLARFEPPTGVTRLIVAADNDEAGLKAAATLR